MTFLGSIRTTTPVSGGWKTKLVTKVSETDRLGRYSYGVQIECQTPKGNKSRLEISSEVLNEMIKCHARDCPNATIWGVVSDIRRKRRGW